MSEMREYIEGFLASREMTLTKLAETLGYRSKTSLNRIMNGSTRPEGVREFERRMVEALSLTTKQRGELHDAVTVAVRGKNVFRANCEMWRFIRGEQPRAAEDAVWVRDAEGGPRQSVAARWRDAVNLQITLVNCRRVPVYTALAELLQREDVRVDHFLLSNRDNAQTIHSINTLMPVLYAKGYQGYIRTLDSEEMWMTTMGAAAADLMLCEYRTPSGEQRKEAIVFDAHNEGIVLPMAGDAQKLRASLGIREELYQPVKRTYFEHSAFEDYIQYSIDYAALERGRAIWKIKPDLCIDYIPADILAAAVREGEMPRDEGFSQVLDELEKIYARRFQDSFSKRCHAHTVLKRSAMRRFARTGRMSDHFWGMRAFTLGERVRILTELRRQQLENPYVHLHFLKDDALVRDVEIACYDGIGILVLQADTDYNLAAGHSEVMISHPEMLHTFQQFFMEELVSDYTLPERMDAEILEELIEECERGEAES